MKIIKFPKQLFQKLSRKTIKGYVLRSKTILIVLHSIRERELFEPFRGFSANISTLNLNLSEKMEKIAWKNSRGRNTGCRRDRDNSKVSSESEEQMQDIFIIGACP